jgi:hypothetical protein
MEALENVHSLLKRPVPGRAYRKRGGWFEDIHRCRNNPPVTGGRKIKCSAVIGLSIHFPCGTAGVDNDYRARNWLGRHGINNLAARRRGVLPANRKRHTACGSHGKEHYRQETVDPCFPISAPHCTPALISVQAPTIFSLFGRGCWKMPLLRKVSRSRGTPRVWNTLSGTVFIASILAGSSPMVVII